MKTSSRFFALTLSAAVAASAATGLLSGCAGTPTKESTGEYIDNTALTAKIKAALISDELVKARDVQVETFKGVVQLAGFVDTAEQKAQAERIAQGMSGVKEVKNNIVVKK